jgi:rubrerythrin
MVQAAFISSRCRKVSNLHDEFNNKKRRSRRKQILEGVSAYLVLKISYLQRTVYLCEICGFGYADDTTANSCEIYCRAHKSCSLQITKKAVLRPQ